MRTHKGKETTFIYNSDLSGDITILFNASNHTTSVSGEDLINFFTAYIRDIKISRIENAETLNDLLKL